MATFTLGPPIPQPSPLDDCPRDHRSRDELYAIERASKDRDIDRRAATRRNADRLLASAGIRFDSKNFGAHLIVYVRDGRVLNFWPGTSKWAVQGEKEIQHGGTKRIIGICAAALAPSVDDDVLSGPSLDALR